MRISVPSRVVPAGDAWKGKSNSASFMPELNSLGPSEPAVLSSSVPANLIMLSMLSVSLLKVEEQKSAFSVFRGWRDEGVMECGFPRDGT